MLFRLRRNTLVWEIEAWRIGTLAQDAVGSGRSSQAELQGKILAFSHPHQHDASCYGTKPWKATCQAHSRRNLRSRRFHHHPPPTSSDAITCLRVKSKLSPFVRVGSDVVCQPSKAMATFVDAAS